MTNDRTSKSERLAALARSFAGRRVLVVGDLLADQFLFGEISRVSREAPVMILRHERTETVPGGAANCAMNLAGLGARAALVGMVGEDSPGRELLESLEVAGVDCSGVVVAPGHVTTTKVRILAGHAHSTRQQVVRLDYEGGTLKDVGVLAEIASNTRAAFEQSEAAVVSDYNYGVACELTVAPLRRVGSGVPVVVDSRFRVREFAGF